MFIKLYTRNDVINAMNAYNTMQSFRKAAKQTGISKSTIHRWWNCPFSIRIRKKRDKKQKRKRINIKSNLELYHVPRISDVFVWNRSN